MGEYLRTQYKRKAADIQEVKNREYLPLENSNNRSNINRNATSDGQILVTANHGTQTGMWVGDYDGRYREIDLHRIIANDIHIGQTDELVFISSSGNQLPELFHMKTLDGRPEKISGYNQVLVDLTLGKVTSITWESDGFEADGVLIYPPDHVNDQSYSVLLYIHGGPMAASLTSFDFFAQAMAAERWIIFRPNYRGSNNLGKAYQRAVVINAGAGPARDVMAGINKLKDRGVETQFIAYPLPGHFPQDPVHRRDVYERWIQWIKELL